jgi:hypothetical protein
MTIDLISDCDDYKYEPGLSLDEPHKEFLKLLFAKEVRYILLGGYAVNYHGYGRPPGDLDIVIDRSAANVGRLLSVMKLIRMGVPPEACEVLTQPDKKMPIPLYEIEVLTSVGNLHFDDLWNRRITAKVGAIDVFVVSNVDLLFMKQHSDREKDQLDYAVLMRLQRGE